MISGNTMDVFSVVFSNGEEFSLMATNTTMARLMATELNNKAEIVQVHRQDGWSDDK